MYLVIWFKLFKSSEGKGFSDNSTECIDILELSAPLYTIDYEQYLKDCTQLTTSKIVSLHFIMVKTKNSNMKAYGLTVRGIIKNDNYEILIVKRHPKSKTDPEMWELPGGKVESGEFFTDALVREIKEEVNLDVNVGDFAEAIQNDYSHKRTVQIMMYLDIIKGEVKISEEHTDWMWASLDKLRTLKLSTSLKKTLIKKNWEI